MAGTLTSLGKQSKTTYLAIEGDKLSVEFTAGATVKNAQPVKLNAAGEVIPWVKADALALLIGYAYTQSLESAAATETVTVFTRGMAMIFAMASGDIDCGPATFSSYNTALADPDGNLGYNVYEAAGANTANAWIIDNPAALGDVVRVILMG